jgi:hypothetical protein
MPTSTFIGLNDKYNAPRSYIQHLVIEFDGAFNFVQTGRVIDLDYPGGGHLKCVCTTRFYHWSSNYYSAPFVWSDTESENTYPGSGGAVGFLAFVFPQIYNGELAMTLRVQFGAGTPHFFTLPQAPAGYWLKQPPL